MSRPRYNDEDVEDLHDGLVEVRSEIQRETDAIIFDFSPALESEDAKEFAVHGVSRRLFMMGRCVDNVYDIFPPERADLLSQDERLDLEISLHAFISNLLGGFDNLAWICAHETGALSTLHPNDIGLFGNKMRRHLPSDLRNHLESTTLADWRSKYAKNYRDALAHRIPLYVAPYEISPADAARYDELGREIAAADRASDLEEVSRLQQAQVELCVICETFRHSLSDMTAKPMRFHPQILADTRTLIEVSSVLRSCFASDA